MLPEITRDTTQPIERYNLPHEGIIPPGIILVPRPFLIPTTSRSYPPVVRRSRGFPWGVAPPRTASSRANQSLRVLHEDGLSERLGEGISSILRRPNWYGVDDAHGLVVGKEVDASVDVLGPLARLKVLGQVHTCRIVDEDGRGHDGF